MRENEQTSVAFLVADAESCIDRLQSKLGHARSDAEQRGRQLERARLFHAVVKRLKSREAIMPEIAQSQVRFR